MNLSNIDLASWALGALLQAALFVVVVVKGRWRVYPVFTAFVGYQNAVTFTLLLVYRVGSADTYKFFFWLSEALCFLLEMAVGVEMFVGIWRGAAQVPPPRWAILLRGGFLCALIAFASAFSVGDAKMPLIDLFAMRGTVFSSLLLCGCFVVVSLEANALLLRRSQRSMTIGWGLTTICLFELTEDISFFAKGWHRGITAFDRTEGVLYSLIVVYWIIGMWRSDRLLPWPRARLMAVRKSL